MTKQWHGGKGSAPRKQSDQKAYEDNWERIFGKKEDEKVEDELSGEDVSDLSDQT